MTAEELRDSIFKDVAGNEGDQALAEINFDLLDTGRWLLKVVSGPNKWCRILYAT